MHWCPKMEDFFDVLINKIKTDDFYALLDCDELSSTDQINAEFRQKAKLLHPDKNPGDQNTAKLFERYVIKKLVGQETSFFCGCNL